MITGQMIFDAVKFYDESCCWFDNLVFKNGTLIFSNIRTADTKERIVLRYDSLIKLHTNHPVCVEFKHCAFRPGNVKISPVNNRLLSVKLASENDQNTHGNGLLGFTFEDCDWVNRSLGRFRLGFDWLGLGLSLDIAPIDSDDMAKTSVDKQSAMLRQQKTYERLKKSLDEQGDTLTASHFHFWSLWYLTRREAWSWGRLIRLGYLITSAFGLSMWRPVLWLGISLLLFALIYAGVFDWMDAMPPCNTWHNRWNAGLDLSLMHPNPLEGLEMKGVNMAQFLHSLPNHQLPYWGGWILWSLILLQNAFQLYLLVMIGAAIRNRVKR